MSEGMEDFSSLYPVTYLGPSWMRDENGKLVLPERTLGWQIAGWVTEYLTDPNSTEDDPKPFRFTNEQLRIILWWYALDASGEFAYRTGLLQRLKGWGKDPLLAVICLVELVGPSRFAYWNSDGSPHAVPHPAAWVQISAVSAAQTQNTMGVFPLIMSEHFKAQFDIVPGAELIRAMGGRVRIEAVTSSYRALEGKRTTFSVFNEVQHWVAGNGGIKMYETAQSNATKLSNRWIAITNAYLPGEGSVGEMIRQDYEDILEGRAPDIGLMYDSIEAHPATPLDPDGIRYAIPLVRGDSWWSNPESIMREIMKSTTSPARSRRMWYNSILADDDALFSEDDWDSLQDPSAVLLPGDEIVLGFDGGRTQDATALVAIRVSDGLIWPILIEERPPDFPKDEHWEVNRARVDSAVHATFAKYRVAAMYCDMAQWESYIAQWGSTYGHAVKLRSRYSTDGNAFGWDMRGNPRRVTGANELLVQMILDKKLKIGRIAGLSRTLRRHVLSTRRRENDYGVSFGRESRNSYKKIDAYAALVAAHAALNDFRQRVKPVEERRNQGWFF